MVAVLPFVAESRDYEDIADAPQASALKVVTLGENAAQVFVPIAFSIGAPGQTPQTTRFLMNLVLVKVPAGWQVSAILPIPAPAP